MFRNLFRKKNYNTNKVFKLSVIDDNGLELVDALGITKERKKELIAIVDEADKKPRLHMVLEQVYSQCKHENEIAYTTLLIGRYHERNEKRNKMLMKMLDEFYGESY